MSGELCEIAKFLKLKVNMIILKATTTITEKHKQLQRNSQSLQRFQNIRLS